MVILLPNNFYPNTTMKVPLQLLLQAYYSVSSSEHRVKKSRALHRECRNNLARASYPVPSCTVLSLENKNDCSSFSIILPCLQYAILRTTGL